MPLSDNQWDNLLAYLNDVAEQPDPSGIGKPIDTAEEFVRFLRSEWDDVIKPINIRNKAKNKELKRIKAQRADMDDVDVRKSLDDRIKELEG